MRISTGGARARRLVFATLGVVSVGLGIVGVFVPGMPTTVFVIAASYLFARSSPALESWLEGNRWLGPSLRRFRQTGGMPLKSKAWALVSMWSGVGVSAYALAARGGVGPAIVIGLGLTGTATILFVVRTTAARQSLILS